MGLALRALGQKQGASERELVAAVRQGDDRAFEELFARYRPRITAYVLGMVRDHARAEDITQEVFLSALRRLRDTERPIAFKPWIYEIARNACIDEFRRTRRATEVSLNGDDDSSGPERDLVSKQPTPDAAMENKQRLEALRGAFRGLSETHHRILVMRELEGLSYVEIADRLDMSKAMVESTLFRARRRLGEEYEDLTTGRRCEQVCEVVDRADARSIKVLGVRARRQVAQHLSHCDDCRRYARLAGADEALFRAPTFADKVAALFPFGWLGRNLGARFIARHLSGASHFFGSSAILGRVAAAVLMVAAAGGGVAGVSLGGGGGKTAATEASALVNPAASRAVAPPSSSSAAGHAVALGAATAANRSGSSGKGVTKPGLGNAGAGKVARGSAAKPHQAPSASNGALVSTSSGAGSPGSGSGSTGHHLLGGGGGAVRKIVSKLPLPHTVVNNAGQAVNRVVNGAGKAVNGVANNAGQAVNRVVNGAGQAVNGVANNAGQAVNGVVGTGKPAVDSVTGSAKQAVQGILGR